MSTAIVFCDDNGYELDRIEEESVSCCTGDIIKVGSSEENHYEIQDKTFVVTKVVYYLDTKERVLEAHLVGGI